MKRKRKEDSKEDSSFSNNSNNVVKKNTKKLKRGKKFENIQEVDETTLEEKTQNYLNSMTQRKGRKQSVVCTGKWIKKSQMVLVDKTSVNPKLLEGMGKREKKVGKWLECEEALFLIERSLLKFRIPSTDDDDDDDDSNENGEEKEIESIQDAFHFFMNKNCLNIDEYIVYCYLKNSGFLVYRHNEEKFLENVVVDDVDVDEKKKKNSDEIKVKFREKRKLPTNVNINSEKINPLICNIQNELQNDQKSVNSEVISDTLSIIKEKKDFESGILNNENKKIVFDVWKRTEENVKKGNNKYVDLKRPSFSVIVTRYTEACPSISLIHELCDKYYPTDIYFAIIESGHVSFMQLTKYEVPSL